jgi:Na+-translocating ferredoxin:NAD+ oxidoreductase subunit A
MRELILLIISAVLVNNFVFARFLGTCPFLGVSKKTETAIGMGMAVIFVLTLSSLFTWLSYEYLLVPYHVEYLQTIVFILIIAAFVQLVEMFIKKASPSLYQALGIYLPLITTNCAVLAVAVINVQAGYSFWESVLFGFGAAVGFALALVLFSGIRERMELSDIPKPLQGTAIALVTAGLLALAFMGFTGLVKM